MDIGVSSLICTNYYRRETINCKYSTEEGMKVRNYVFVERKEQAILAFILLDRFRNRPAFV